MSIQNKSICPFKDLYVNIYSGSIYSSQNWKKNKYLPRVEWINKLCYIHTMQYELEIKQLNSQYMLTQ